MKKLTCLLICLMMVFSIAACGNINSVDNTAVEETIISQGNVIENIGESDDVEQSGEFETTTVSDMQETGSQPASDDTEAGKGALIVYFSMPDNVDDSTVVIDGEILGNTQYVAYVICENIGADIFHIEPEMEYPTDHEELVDLASKEKEENVRPAIKGTVENIADYDTVFLGFPIWWSDFPMIIYSFLDEYDLCGKTIIPFSTHGGSRLAGTIDTLKTEEPDADIYEDALCISRDDVEDAEQQIIEWVNSLNLN